MKYKTLNPHNEENIDKLTNIVLDNADQDELVDFARLYLLDLYNDQNSYNAAEKFVQEEGFDIDPDLDWNELEPWDEEGFFTA